MLVLITVSLVSCDLIQNDQTTAGGTGNVVVSITDAPFPAGLVDKVLITVDTVELRVAGGTCTGMKGEHIGGTKTGTISYGHDYSDFHCDSGFVVVSTGKKEFDLLKLQNGVSSILATAKIPVGKYDMVRMELVKVSIVVGTNTYDITIPANAHNGLRIKLDTVLVITSASTSNVLVDIDLSRSFITLGDHRSKGGILGFIFNPVIRAVNHNKSGSIYGRVYEGTNTAVSGAQITVARNDTTITTAVTNDKGLYQVIGLSSGTYKVTASKDGYKPVTSDNIKISSKREFRQDFKLVKL